MEVGRARCAWYLVWTPGLLVSKGARGRRDAPLHKMEQAAALICHSSFTTTNWSQQHYVLTVLHMWDFTITSQLFVSGAVFSYLFPHLGRRNIAELYLYLAYILEVYLWDLCSPEEKESFAHFFFFQKNSRKISCVALEPNWRHSEPQSYLPNMTGKT